MAFGLFLASILFLLGVSLVYVFVVGFVSFIPDIDWLMDKVWFSGDSLFKRFWFKVFKSKSIHRKLLHNVWFMLFFMALFGYFSGWDLLVVFSVMIGYVSHLFMDSLTRSGVYWLWPYGDENIFSRQRFYWKGKFVTGKLEEKFLYSVLVVAGGVIFGLGFYRNYYFSIGGDLYQTLLIVAILVVVGVFLMEVLVKEISRALSRMFR